MPIDKVCQRCGRQFKVRPRDASQVFCGRTCKIEHEAIYGRANALVPTIDFVCKVCATPFTMKPGGVRAYRKKWGKNPMYCSTKCGGIGRKLTDEDWDVNCVQCGKRMPIQRQPGGTINRHKRLCSTTCRSLFRRLSYRKNNPNQTTTKRVGRHGYIRILIPGTGEIPSRDLFEHRYVMEQKLGRALYPEETVHHINGDRTFNDPSNLELFSSRHGPGQRVIDKIAFAVEMIRLYPELARTAGIFLCDCGKHLTAATP